MNLLSLFTNVNHIMIWTFVAFAFTSIIHAAEQPRSPRLREDRKISPARTSYSRRYYARGLRVRPSYATLRARSGDRLTPARREGGQSETTGRRIVTYSRRAGISPYTGKKYISTPARRIRFRYPTRLQGGRFITTRHRPTYRRLTPRGRISTTTKPNNTVSTVTSRNVTNTTTAKPRIKPSKPSTRKTLVNATKATTQSSTPTTEPSPPPLTLSLSSSVTTTTAASTTTETTTTTAAAATTTTTERDRVKTSASSPSTTVVSTTSRTSTQASRRTRRPIYAPRRTQHTSSSKNSEYYSPYYFAMAQTERRLGDLLDKQIQRSREENRKLWKGIFSVKSDVRKVDRRCNAIQRNYTIIANRVKIHSRELDKYKESHKQKIDQIETHQGSQDQHYFEVYQTSTNNSRQIASLANRMSSLMPIVADIAVKVEASNEREEKALEMLTSHTQESFAGMSSQIRVQQRTVANLGNQVRTELDLLHAVKQSMSRRMQQNHRKLSDDVNAHLSAHTTQINQVETTMTRQAERIKYLTAIVKRHNDLLDSDDLIDVSLMKHVDNITNYLGMMYTNLSRVSQTYEEMLSKVTSMERKMAMFGTTAYQVSESIANHSKHSSQLEESHARTVQEVERISNHLDTLTRRHDEESESLRNDLDKALETQKIYQKNISAIQGWNAESGSDRRALSQYFADEPVSDTPLQVTQTFRRLLIELGVEDRISRLTRLQHLQRHRMENVTRKVQKLAHDKDEITDTTTHYLSIIKSQADLIKDQNKTITKLAMMVNDQDVTIGSLGDELMDEQENVRKLTIILANMAANAKNPMASQRDCHDLWLNGHRQSGVYNIIENMKFRPVQCNMTEYGGWTIIQNRRDGSQDFDQTYDDYRYGFGDVYGEYWLGLDGIKTITRKVRTNVVLRIIMEDWNGETRTATYSQFYLYGKRYSISIGGYEGDAGDSFSNANGLHFSAKLNDDDYGNACNSRRRAGWWFSNPQNDCGASNLNGVYKQFSDIKASGSSAIHWKSWHGSAYPLKRASMQIIPTEVLDNLNEVNNQDFDLANTVKGSDSTLNENDDVDYRPPLESYNDEDVDYSLDEYNQLFVNDG